MRICAHCDRVIAVTVKEPAITAGSLGAGAFHERCAAEVWRRLSLDASSRKEESSARRSAMMRARHVGRKSSAESLGTPSIATLSSSDLADSFVASAGGRRRRRSDGEAYRLPAEDE